MSQETLAAKQELIDKQAEAAKAAEVVSEVEHQEFVAEVAALPTPEPIEEEDEDIQWLRSELSALKTMLQEVKDSQQQQLQNLSAQLLQSMTEVFTTAIATIQLQSNPQALETPQVETVPEAVSVVQTPESAEVPSEQKTAKRVRRI